MFKQRLLLLYTVCYFIFSLHFVLINLKVIIVVISLVHHSFQHCPRKHKIMIKTEQKLNLPSTLLIFASWVCFTTIMIGFLFGVPLILLFFFSKKIFWFFSPERMMEIRPRCYCSIPDKACCVVFSKYIRMKWNGWLSSEICISDKSEHLLLNLNLDILLKIATICCKEVNICVIFLSLFHTVTCIHYLRSSYSRD